MSQQNVEIVRRWACRRPDSPARAWACQWSPVREREVHVFRLRDGKISERREYRQKDEALKAVGVLP